jgi:hypothetical protein
MGAKKRAAPKAAQKLNREASNRVGKTTQIQMAG